MYYTAQYSKMFDAQRKMNDTSDRLREISRGDRILLALFTPPFIGILGWLAWLPQQIQTNALYGRIMIWVISDFFTACCLFASLLWLWVLARPKWVEALLVAAITRVVRYLVAFFCVAAVGNLIAFLFLRN